MKKFFDKEPVWFAVIWIGVYVLAFGNADTLSQSMGIPKLLTAAVGLVLTAVLLTFLKKHSLLSYAGLCLVRGSGGRFLWYLPLAVITSVNLWNGIAVQTAPLETLLYILSMCFVGILEEVIFRGLLFQAMRPGNERIAVVVSSLTFGMGHAVNLLLGAPVGETMLQLVYASAIGFCYTALFCVGGSIVPCILSHCLVNSMSVFAVTPDLRGQAVISAVQTVLSVSYGVWLLRQKKN